MRTSSGPRATWSRPSLHTALMPHPRSPLSSVSLPTVPFSFCCAGPAFEEVGVGLRTLSWPLLPLDRRLSPSEKGLAACYTCQTREIVAEEPAHLLPVPRVERGIRCRKLAQRTLGIFGYKVNDRHPSPGRLRHKPHGFGQDTQASPRLRVLLVARTRKFLQKPPPGLFLVRLDRPRQQQNPTHRCQHHRLSSAVSFVQCVRLFLCTPFWIPRSCLPLRCPRWVQ